MSRFLIFGIAILCAGIGWSFRDREPMPMDITISGDVLYPLSSGSNDIAVLSLGLLTFIVTAIYALVSLVFNHNLKYLAYVYIVNFVLFMFFAALVSLDSSFVVAAKLGDPLPLIGVVLTLMPVPVFIFIHLTGVREGRRKGAAPLNFTLGIFWRMHCE